jgi:hypothetical protein
MLAMENLLHLRNYSRKKDTLNKQGGDAHDQRFMADPGHDIRRSAGNICHRIGERREG